MSGETDLSKLNVKVVNFYYGPTKEVTAGEDWAFFYWQDDKFVRSTLENFAFEPKTTDESFISVMRFERQEYFFTEWTREKIELQSLISVWRLTGHEKQAIDLLSSLCGPAYCVQCDEGVDHDFEFGESSYKPKAYSIPTSECKFYAPDPYEATPEMRKLHQTYFGDGGGVSQWIPSSEMKWGGLSAKETGVYTVYVGRSASPSISESCEKQIEKQIVVKAVSNLLEEKGRVEGEWTCEKGCGFDRNPPEWPECIVCKRGKGD